MLGKQYGCAKGRQSIRQRKVNNDPSLFVYIPIIIISLFLVYFLFIYNFAICHKLKGFFRAAFISFGKTSW